MRTKKLGGAVAVAIAAAALSLAPALGARSAQQVEKTFGRTAPGSTFGFPGANRKYGSAFTLPEKGSVTKITALMRGRLAGSASAGLSQRFRTMIYAADGPGGAPGTLLATSAERVLADNAPQAYYDFAVNPPVSLPAGKYWLMQQSGPTSAQVGLSEDTVSPGNQRFNIDPYADGPSNPAGPTTAEAKEYVLSATYVTAAGGGGAQKVVICHKPGTKHAKTMEVPPAAVAGHLGHGDHLGSC